MDLLHDPGTPVAASLNFDDFLKVDFRIGRIISAERFPEAPQPAYKLKIDFGATVSVKQSSAQITTHYQIDRLVGKKVAALVNFQPRQIRKFRSEVLMPGFPDSQGEVVLFAPDQAVPNGSRLF